jgi:hypothetical protein
VWFGVVVRLLEHMSTAVVVHACVLLQRIHRKNPSAKSTSPKSAAATSAAGGGRSKSADALAALLSEVAALKRSHAEMSRCVASLRASNDALCAENAVLWRTVREVDASGSPLLATYARAPVDGSDGSDGSNGSNGSSGSTPATSPVAACMHAMLHNTPASAASSRKRGRAGDDAVGSKLQRTWPCDDDDCLEGAWGVTLTDSDSDSDVEYKSHGGVVGMASPRSRAAAHATQLPQWCVDDSMLAAMDATDVAACDLGFDSSIDDFLLTSTGAL